MAEGKYTFRVNDRAHKTQISHAVEEIFGVKVVAVRTSRVRSQAEAPRPAPGKTRAWKKAIVELAPGDQIELFEGERTERLMAIRKTKPTSPGRRFATYQDRSEVTTSKPHKKLTKGKKSTGGRNANGRVTARHRGGGAKRKYRQIDFKRTKDGVPAKVATIEYDPNRTTYIALLHYADGAKAYILAPQGVDGRRPSAVRPRLRHPPGQRARARRDPDRHHGPQRRAQARPGRPHGPRRRHRDPGRRQGRRHGHASPSLLGDAHGRGRVPRDHRHALQRRAPERRRRQGRPQPPQGQAARRAAASR